MPMIGSVQRAYPNRIRKRLSQKGKPLAQPVKQLWSDGLRWEAA
jgi:hypothetical protein